MGNDANRINELLAQLQNSTAFQSVVASSSSQAPNLPADSTPTPAPASIPPQPPASGSTVFDLLSRLNPGASSSNQPPPPIKSSQPPPPINESNEKPPTPISVPSPVLDLRFMTVQQALPHIAKLTQRAEFRENIKKIQEAQNRVEQSLYASQQGVMKQHEQRLLYAKNKANITGIPLSDKDSQDLELQLTAELKKFHTNQVLVSWDAQRTKQQTQLESLGVPCMFVTSDPAALQRQQKVLRILLESLSESEDME